MTFLSPFACFDSSPDWAILAGCYLSSLPSTSAPFGAGVVDRYHFFSYAIVLNGQYPPPSALPPGEGEELSSLPPIFSDKVGDDYQASSVFLTANYRI